MTDKELLELAAKAAGIELIGFADIGCWAGEELAWGYQTADYDRWNPLTDDGDALRLAVKLKCLRGFVYDNEVAWAASELGIFEPIIDGDTYAATRRAIVRAAAEIGKEMN